MPLLKDTIRLGDGVVKRKDFYFKKSFFFFFNRRLGDEVSEVCFSLDRDPSSHPYPLLTVAK